MLAGRRLLEDWYAASPVLAALRITNLSTLQVQPDDLSVKAAMRQLRLRLLVFSGLSSGGSMARAC